MEELSIGAKGLLMRTTVRRIQGNVDEDNREKNPRQ
jgi:hypothetical protein